MQIISKLSDMIEEELADAEKYINCALANKESDPTLANTFYKLSVEEMGHMAMLHDNVVAKIAEYKKEHGNPPERMQGIYDYVHKKHMEKANTIKALQNVFKAESK